MKGKFIKQTLIVLVIVLISSAFFAACTNTGKDSSASGSTSSAENNTSSGNTSFVAPVDFSTLSSGSYDSKTETPVISESRTVADGRAVFAGTCEDGATIYAVRDNKILLSSKSYCGNFLFELSVKKNDNPTDISIYAKIDKKALSDAVQSQAYYNTNDKGISDWVWVGKDFHLFFSDTANNYFRRDTLSDKKAESAKQIISERVKWLNDNLGAKPIYILVPNPNEIYGEYMPDVGTQPDKQSLHDQTAKLLSDAGAVVIDMKPILEQHKNDKFEIYHRTDSHWTEYAAFYAYTELFNYISKDYPASKPRPIEDFGFENESRQVGDLYTDIAMDVTKLHETSVYSHLKFTTPVDIPKYKNSESTLIADEPTKENFFTNHDGEGKPNVIILRDSYSIMMFDFISERCANTTIRAMWDFSFDKELFKGRGVNYVIYIICDMNLKNLYK